MTDAELSDEYSDLYAKAKAASKVSLSLSHDEYVKFLDFRAAAHPTDVINLIDEVRRLEAALEAVTESQKHIHIIYEDCLSSARKSLAELAMYHRENTPDGVICMHCGNHWSGELHGHRRLYPNDPIEPPIHKDGCPIPKACEAIRTIDLLSEDVILSQEIVTDNKRLTAENERMRKALEVAADYCEYAQKCGLSDTVLDRLNNALASVASEKEKG